MLGRTNAVSISGGGGTGDTIYVENATGAEVTSNQKVLLNCNAVSMGIVAGGLDLSHSLKNLAPNLYKSGSELCRLSDLHVLLSIWNNNTVYYRYKNLIFGYQNSVDSKSIATCDIAKGFYKELLSTLRPGFSYDGNVICGSYSNITDIFLYKVNDDLSTTRMRFTVPDSNYWPAIYDPINNVVALLWNKSGHDYILYTYKIDWEQNTATLMLGTTWKNLVGVNNSISLTNCVLIGNNTFLYLSPTTLVKITIQEDGSATSDVIYGSRQKYFSLLSLEHFNTQNKTFTVIDSNKILTVLQYDDEDLTLKSILTRDLSNVDAGYELSTYSNISDDYKTVLLQFYHGPTSGSYKLWKITLSSDVSDIKAEAVNDANLITTTLTGFATGQKDETGKIEVSTTLPEKQNINITTNADNATITAKGVD